MLYPFMTLNDNTEIVHSESLQKDGKEQVEVRIEKPVYDGFHSASCWLPDYKWENIDGFSDEEIKYFQDYLASVAHIIMQLAREGGFSEDLIEGERVLPSMLNPTPKRNAEPFYIKDKTKPKEQYTQTLWWTRHEWAGRGETREVTDFVTIPRERYARIKFEPYSVELFLKYDEQGQLMVMTDPISYCHDNEKLLINTINIFLTNFEECEVLTENFENVMPTRIIKLNWEVLPSGDYPWERMRDDLQKASEKSSKTAKKLLIDKCEKQ